MKSLLYSICAFWGECLFIYLVLEKAGLIQKATFTLPNGGNVIFESSDDKEGLIENIDALFKDKKFPM